MQHFSRVSRLPDRRRRSSWLFALGLVLITPLAALEYRDHAGLTSDLKALAASSGGVVRVTKQGLTAGNREVWMAEIGSGTDEARIRRPALLLVAGIEAGDLVGSSVAVEWARQLASGAATNESLRTLLDQVTVYVFPRLNPDAAESFFARPRVEQVGNMTPTDSDHDGLIDEDGPEDLNGDGLITSMRVESLEGEYILDPREPRLLIKADKAKGEKGAWKLLSEGVDNDKDELWNEDPIGGVNLNRNFPYGYQFFGEASGRHPVSEPESRALADFLVAHPNIGIVFTYGDADNLIQAPKSEPGGKRPPTAISDADAPVYKELGRLYRESLGLKKELEGRAEPGSFSDWAYFHRGRLSLAARPWTLALEIELANAAKESQAKEGDKKPEDAAAKPKDDAKPAAADAKKIKPDKEDKRGEADRAALKWITEHAPEGFVTWTPFSHPDFPGQRVEVGGWAPGAQENPPTNLLETVAARQTKFLTELAGKLPRVGIRKAAARPLGQGVFELTVQIENTGYLPTTLAQGALTREVLPTRVSLVLEDKQILAGQKTTLLGPIPGSGGMEELRYIVRAKGQVDIQAISALGGSSRRTIELKEEP